MESVGPPWISTGLFFPQAEAGFGGSPASGNPLFGVFSDDVVSISRDRTICECAVVRVCTNHIALKRLNWYDQT